MEYVFLIFALFFALVIACLLLSNSELRKENENLFNDNHELFLEKTSSNWELELKKAELKVIKAEYGIKDPAPKRKRHVINCVEKGKQSPHCK